MRRRGNSPEDTATDREQQRQHRQLGAGYALRAALAVVPGQHQRDEETERERDDEYALELLGPAKALTDDVDGLQQRECAGEIGQRPLHDLAVPEPVEEAVQAKMSPATSATPQVYSRRPGRQRPSATSDTARRELQAQRCRAPRQRQLAVPRRAAGDDLAGAQHEQPRGLEPDR